WVIASLFGVNPPVPAPNTPGLKTRSDDPNVTAPSMREQMQEHRSKPECANCHRLMDPIGLALENFDAIGMWRTRDGAAPLDVTDILYDGTKIDGPGGLRRWLASYPDPFVQTLTERLMTYALGRGAGFQDMPVIRSIDRAASHDNNR